MIFFKKKAFFIFFTFLCGFTFSQETPIELNAKTKQSIIKEKDALEKAKNTQSEAQKKLEDAQAILDEAQENLAENPDDKALKKEVSDAQKTLKASQSSLTKAEKAVEKQEAKLNAIYQKAGLDPDNLPEDLNLDSPDQTKSESAAPAEESDQTSDDQQVISEKTKQSIIKEKDALEKAKNTQSEAQKKLEDVQAALDEAQENLAENPDDKALKKEVSDAQKTLKASQSSLTKAEKAVEKQETKLNAIYQKAGLDPDNLPEDLLTAESTTPMKDGDKIELTRKQKETILSRRHSVETAQVLLDDSKKILAEKEATLEKATQDLADSRTESESDSDKKIDEKTRLILVSRRDAAIKAKADFEASQGTLEAKQTALDDAQTALVTNPEDKDAQKAVSNAEKDLKNAQAGSEKAQKKLENEEEKRNALYEKVGLDPDNLPDNINLDEPIEANNEEVFAKLVARARKELKVAEATVAKAEQGLQKKSKSLADTYRKIGLDPDNIPEDLNLDLGQDDAVSTLDRKSRIRLQEKIKRVDEKILAVIDLRVERKENVDVINENLSEVNVRFEEMMARLNEANDLKLNAINTAKNEKVDRKNLRRKLRIEKLEASVAFNNEELNAIPDLYEEESSRIEALTGEFDALQEKINETSEKIKRLNADSIGLTKDERKDVKAQKKEVEKELKLVKKEASEFEKQIAAAKKNLEQNQETRNRIESISDASQTLINELQKKLILPENILADVEILPIPDTKRLVSLAKKDVQLVKQEVTNIQKQLFKATIVHEQMLEKEADLQREKKYYEDLLSEKKMSTKNIFPLFSGDGYAFLASNIEINNIKDFSTLLFYAEQNIKGSIANYDLEYKISFDFYANLFGIVKDDDIFSFKHSNMGAFSLRWNNNKVVEFDVSEYWVQFSPSIVDLLFGKKRLRYGTANVYSPLDIINPEYVHSKHIFDTDDLKLGSFMFSVTTHYPKDLGYFQAFFIPVPSTNIYGSYFAKRVEDNPLSYKYFEGGFRSLFNFGPVQLSFMGFSIFDRAPNDIFGYYIYSAEDESQLTITEEVYGHGRRYIAGLDLAAQVVNFLKINFEAAFVMTDDLILDANAALYPYSPIVQSSFIEGALEFQFETPQPTPVFIDIIYSPKYILNTSIPEVSNRVWQFDNIIGIRVAAKIGSNYTTKTIFEPEFQFLVTAPSLQWEGKLALGVQFLPQWYARVWTQILGTFDDVKSEKRKYGKFYVGGGNSIIDNASKVCLEFRFAW
ncbi:MAG: hypothetical protein ACRC5H_02270 [Treponemataceae bacterium]